MLLYLLYLLTILIFVCRSHCSTTFSLESLVFFLQIYDIKKNIDFHVHSFGGPAEDPYINNCLHRIIDIEESDKETMHLLIFLFMQFLSRSDQAFPTEEKPVARTQMIVMRHVYLLIGYSPTDKLFHITPPRLR